MSMAYLDDLDRVIAHLEAARGQLGPVVDTSLALLRAQLRRGRHFAQRRRLVTILRANLSGFKARTDALEAEEVLSLMNLIWGRLDAVVSSYGGFVDKHLDSTLLAVWGVDISQENDTERAIRAALDLQTALAELPGTEDLHLRIGIHTGYAHMGYLQSTGEFVMLGHAVKIAALAEEQAAPKTIVITHDSFRHVRGAFEVSKHSALMAVTGKSATITTYRVLSASPIIFRSSGRGIEGIEPPMIGRADILETLQQSLLSLNTARVFQISGESGLGKTRLLYAFQDWIELSEEFTVWFMRARAGLNITPTPYALLRDMLASRLQIKSNDTPDYARRKLQNGLKPYLPDEEKVHFIGHLIGFDFSNSPYLSTLTHDQEQIQLLAVRYLSELFHAMYRVGGQDSILILLEDMQWADEASCQVLEGVLQACAKLPLMLLYATRAGSQPMFKFPTTVFQLEPLSAAESRQLMAEILHKFEQVPEDLVALVLRQAEGNPFYIEELLKMLIDEGVVQISGEVWRLRPEGLKEALIPSTLAEVLQTRLDMLPPAERLVLQCGAVIGRHFWDSSVQALMTGLPDFEAEALPQLLADLTARELIYARSSSLLQGAKEYFFKHVLLHEFTYNSLGRQARDLFHFRAAEWLLQQGGERSGEYVEQIARHYAEGQHLVLASQYLTQAAEQAHQRGVYQEALRFYRQAYEFQPESLELGLRLAKLLIQQADYSQAEKLLGALLAGSIETTRGKVLTELAHVAWRRGNYVAASDYLEEAEGLAARDTLLLGEIARHQGVVARVLGQYRLAHDLAQTAYHRFAQVGDKGGIISSLTLLGTIARFQGDYLKSERIYQDALERARAQHDQWNMGILLLNLGDVARLRHNLRLAKDCFKRGLEICQTCGNQQGVAGAQLNLAIVAAQEGAYSEAEAYLRHVLPVFLQMGSQTWVLMAISIWAEVLIRLGDYATALRWLGRVEGDLMSNQEIREINAETRRLLVGKLSEEQVSAYLQEGAGLPLEHILAQALGR
jgi:class 3 adenylate cyclase/tetratricopeptide (TPR) repeat protein